MEGKYKGTYVIKPCIEGHETFSLRTSSLEGSFVANKYDQPNPFRSRTNTMEGNMFEEVVMASINSESAGKFLCANYLDRLNNTQMKDWMCESKSGKDLEYFKYKLENFYPVEIAEEYYTGKVIAMQTAMSRWVECGKYLVEITGTSDLLTSTSEIIDLKYYGAVFGEKGDEEYDIHTLENFSNSRLSTKKQWYIYPRLLDKWDSEGDNIFEYHLYKKSKNAPSKNKPNNHLSRIVYNCVINKDLAEQQVKKDLINYVKNCKLSGTKLGERVDINDALDRGVEGLFIL